MRIAIYTNDLTRDNVHLMPWRTVVEVTAGMRKAGHDAVVLSGRPGARGEEWVCGTVPIREVAKSRTPEGRSALLDYIRQERFDILYWPFAWWGAGKARKLLERLNLRIVGYVPGSRYLFRSVLRAIPSIGLRFSLPYLAQSLYSDSRLVAEMKRGGVGSAITMTEFSRRALIRGGWPEDRIVAIPPGKSPVAIPETDAPVFRRVMESVGDKPFFLFFGPPTPIRGVNQLLDAFPRVAAANGDARLVCLFRADPNVDMPLFRQKIERLGLGDRVQCVWESVTQGELAAFLNACHAVVLPFLIVPSEIPLAIIEVLEYGKPVIVSNAEGTGRFCRPFGVVTAPGNVAQLSAAMVRLREDLDLYTKKSAAAEVQWRSHPTWGRVADRWGAVLDEAISAVTA